MVLSPLSARGRCRSTITLSRRVPWLRICLIAGASMSIACSSNAAIANAARPETSPSGVVNQSNGEQWSFFVSSEGEVAYWHRSSSKEGWSKHVIGGNVKTGTSPSALIYKSGEIFVYYVNTKGEIANWTYSEGLWVGRAFGGEVAENSSPSAATNATNTVQYVTYIDKAGEVADFLLNSKGWFGPSTIGGKVRADTSPTVTIWENKSAFVYYVNTKGEIANWTFSPPTEEWVGRAFGGKVAENNSPSAASNASGSVMLVSFMNTHEEVDDFLWNGSSWAGPVEIGGEAKAGTNTSTILNKSAEVLVYYVNKSAEIASWTLSGETWTAATRGGKVEGNTSPSATIYVSKGYQYIFFMNGSADVSDFAFEPAEWIGPTVL
jgi:hypothetical protein